MSTHNTLTLASVSTQFISCTITFFFPSLITLTTSATLASRYSPSGIIPTREATIESILLFIEPPTANLLCKNSPAPIGIIRTPIVLTSLSRDCIISVLCFFRPAFASIASFAAYASRPTFVSTALHSPDTIKLPESNISPAFLTTSSDSPVTNDSLTRTNPSTRIASALSWFPAENTHKSPLTRVSEATVCNCPSLITDVLGALTTVSLSRTFLALIS